jgi:hypothetical protein
MHKANLESDVRKLVGEIHKLEHKAKADNDRFQGVVDDLNRTAQESHDAYLAAAAEASELQDKIGYLNVQLSKISDSEAKQTEMIMEFDKKCVDLERDNYYLRNELQTKSDNLKLAAETFAADLEAAKRENLQLKDEIARLNQQIPKPMYAPAPTPAHAPAQAPAPVLDMKALAQELANYWEPRLAKSQPAGQGAKPVFDDIDPFASVSAPKLKVPEYIPSPEMRNETDDLLADQNLFIDPSLQAIVDQRKSQTGPVLLPSQQQALYQQFPE